MTVKATDSIKSAANNGAGQMSAAKVTTVVEAVVATETSEKARRKFSQRWKDRLHRLKKPKDGGSKGSVSGGHPSAKSEKSGTAKPSQAPQTKLRRQDQPASQRQAEIQAEAQAAPQIHPQRHSMPVPALSRPQDRIPSGASRRQTTDDLALRLAMAQLYPGHRTALKQDDVERATEEQMRRTNQPRSQAQGQVYRDVHLGRQLSDLESRYGANALAEAALLMGQAEAARVRSAMESAEKPSRRDSAPPGSVLAAAAGEIG